MENSNTNFVDSCNFEIGELNTFLTCLNIVRETTLKNTPGHNRITLLEKKVELIIRDHFDT